MYIYIKEVRVVSAKEETNQTKAKKKEKKLSKRKLGRNKNKLIISTN
jgi:hypothetical protein